MVEDRLKGRGESVRQLLHARAVQEHIETLDHDIDQRLMEAMGKARNLSVQGVGNVEIGGDVYKALEALNHAIDDVCVVTGRPREHFWAKANSA